MPAFLSAALGSDPPARRDLISLFMPGLNGGGAERVMLTLAQEFVEKGHRVDLVLTRAEGVYKKEVPRGVRVVDLCATRIVTSLPALVRYLRRERPAVMLSALGATNCLAVWARSVARVRTGLVIAEHTTPSQAAAHTTSTRARFLPMLMKWSYRHSDVIVAVSGGVAEDLAHKFKIPRNRICTIYNPVITPAFREKARESVKHPWLEPGRPPVILAVGRLTRAKDFQTLIRAFAIVRRSRVARLMILGEGEERRSLEELVRSLRLEECVEIPGFISNPYRYMRRAAIFVLSSRWEGLPTVLIEALACGIPIVSTDCPSGPAEILGPYQRARLVPVGDSEAMANAMEDMLGSSECATVDPELSAEFSLDAATARYLHVLDPWLKHV